MSINSAGCNQERLHWERERQREKERAKFRVYALLFWWKLHVEVQGEKEGVCDTHSLSPLSSTCVLNINESWMLVLSHLMACWWYSNDVCLLVWCFWNNVKLIQWLNTKSRPFKYGNHVSLKLALDLTVFLFLFFFVCVLTVVHYFFLLCWLG